MGILNYWVSDEEMAMCSDEGVALWNRKGDNINVVGARVGIGTTDPRADLHVRGTILADRFIKTDGTAISSGSSVWQESNGNAFRDSGKVGIGTQDPQARLHIEGGNLLVGPKPDQSVSTINAIGNGSLQNNGVVRSNRGLMIRKQSAANPLQGFVFISGGDNGQTGTLTMYNGATAPAIAVKVMATGNSFFNGGNVGIGTTTPTAKLEVNGNLKVTGSIDFDGPRLRNGNIVESVNPRACERKRITTQDSGNPTITFTCSAPEEFIGMAPFVECNDRTNPVYMVADSSANSHTLPHILSYTCIDSQGDFVTPKHVIGYCCDIIA
jgi:hypothetical protein